MILLKLTLKSLWNRRVSLILTILSIAISMSLLLGVEYIRKEAKSSFLSTISGTDLVVGARSGPVQLLLYSVFRIGNATNNIGWDSYQNIKNNKYVKWSIPLSLGDSHRGYRVLGTNDDYFKYYRYSNKQNITFAKGKAFSGLYDAAIGAEVAKKLNYKINDKIILSHGAGVTSFSKHKDKPFRISGILKPTGTPIDRTVHVSLEAIEAIHVDWQSGAQSRNSISAEETLKMELKPEQITAFLLGLKNRTATFKVQRAINEYKSEPLLATVPGIALAELWQTIGHFESILRIITGFVVIAGLIGMLTTLISTLNERRREMAILRAIGAYPRHIFILFLFEAVIIITLACLFGIILLYLILIGARPWILSEYGLQLSYWIPDMNDWIIIGLVAVIAIIFSIIPGAIAYKRSLQDGLTIRF